MHYGSPRHATVTVSVSMRVTDRAGFQRLLQETGGLRADLAQGMLARAQMLTAQ